VCSKLGSRNFTFLCTGFCVSLLVKHTQNNWQGPWPTQEPRD
jgi:hypothetical protein